MSELLVWTGTHPDEKRALAVGDSLRRDPRPNIKTKIANPEALKLNRRFVDDNLMLAYPGDPGSRIYEKRRAVEVLKISRGFRRVADVHDGAGFGDTSAEVNRTQGVDPRILSFFGAIGLKNLVVSNEGGIQEHIPNAFLVETGPDITVEQLIEGFTLLANDSVPLPPRTVADFKWFEFLESLHEDLLHPDDLSPEEFANLRSFTVHPRLSKIMGRKVCLMSWGNTVNEQGYWAELVTPCDPPDTSRWPGNHLIAW